MKFVFPCILFIPNNIIEIIIPLEISLERKGKDHYLSLIKYLEKNSKEEEKQGNVYNYA